ncbi:MAG: hypothetical protein RLZZ455_907 [Candidatus Parcubacteria bacterium]
MKNAIIYIRVSDPSQIENASFDVQTATCERYAKEQGWKIVKIFKEEGESAKFADRTKLKELIEYCRVNKGKIDVCLVYKLDRFARNQIDHYAIKARLMDYGVSVKSATEPVDDSIMGKAMEGMLAILAELDNNVKSQRVKDAMRNWIMKGRWVWGAKPGYVNRKDETDHAVIALDPDKAPAITELFTRFSTGHYTYKQLAYWLNNEKHLRGKQGKKFHAQGVQKILKDKFYIGIIEMYDEQIKGVHAPLTDEYTFYKCQEIILARSNHTNKKRVTESEDFPMRRFLLCPSCKQKLTAAWCKGNTKRYAKYYCVTKGCVKKSKTYSRDEVHDKFYNLLLKIQPKEDSAKLFREMFIRVYKKRIMELEGDTIRAKAEVDSLEAEKVNIQQMIKKQVYTYEEGLKELEEVRDKLTVARLGLNESKTDIEEINLCLAYAENFIQTIAKVWFDAPSLLKIKLQTMVFPNGLAYGFEDISNHNLSLPFKLNSEFEENQSLNVSPDRFELSTKSLKGSCSTAELQAHIG